MARVQMYDDPAAFHDAAAPYVRDHALRATVLATALAQLLDGEQVTAAQAPTPFWFVLQRESGAVTGLGMRYGDYPPYLLDIRPFTARDVADRVLATGERPGGANGTPESARAFCERLIDVAGGSIETAMSQRLFRLETLRPPQGVPGHGGLATVADADLLADWMDAFALEAGAAGSLKTAAQRRAENRAFIEQKIAQQRLFLWTDQGRVVSMAGARPPALKFARIGPVYTPPADRERGYAAAVTALASQALLAEGATPCLFTDLANATSNGVYTRIGYQPVMDTVNLQIVRPGLP